MRFFALDCHIGIADMKSIFAELGHSLDVHTISSHASLMGWEKDNSFVINEHNWQALSSANHNLFFETHKKELAKYDGFVCFYPPAFSMLYEKFDKPIIVHVPIRFETPFQHRPHELAQYIQHLKRTIDNGQLHALANNRFDAEFCSDIVERDFKLIPSLCDYHIVNRSKKIDKVVVHGDTHNRIPDMQNLVRLTRGYTWGELYSHKAVVHLPYHNTVMSLFEQYSANMPILMPSDDFMMKLWREDSNSVMSQVSWLKVDNRQQRNLHATKCVPDINMYENENAIRYIVEKSDWNDKEWMPHVIKFDSWRHLEELTHDTIIDDTHQLMLQSASARKISILDAWNNTLGRI